MHPTSRPPAEPRPVRHLTLLGTTALALLAALLFTSAPFSRTIAADTLWVCQTGAPTCDFASIQAAIDASAAGDVILVDGGVYSESLTLRTDLTIRGNAADMPTLTAASAPLVSASGIQSATLSQLNIDGRGVLTTGLAMTDVNLFLNAITIRNLGGRDGKDGAVNGDDVTAISMAGTGSLHASDLHIEQLRAGHGLIVGSWDFEAAYRGGDAIGIAVTGSYLVDLERTAIAALFGGDAGNSTDDPYGCHGRGGDAIGIVAQGSVVRLDQLAITDLYSGRPCAGLAEHCVGYAGAYTGVFVRGGTLAMTAARLTNLRAHAAHSSPINAGIVAQEVAALRLDGVRIERGETQMATVATAAMKPAAPDSPFCVEPPLALHAIRIEGADQVIMHDLDIRNVWGRGWGGEAAAITIADAADVALTASSIDNISGGYDYLTTFGISLDKIGQLLISGNEIRALAAKDSPRLSTLYYLNYGHDGGSAMAIRARDVVTGTIANNIIWGIHAGAGANAYAPNWPNGTDGGDAAGMVLEESRLMLAHNSIVQTHGGQGGSPDGQAGRSHGVLATNSDLQLVATALAGHDTGLSHMSGALRLAANSFWRNDIDTVGGSPSATALHIDPGFVDLAAGDLHLRPDSGLIDRAGDYGPAARLLDIDGQPRPLDGDNDDVFRADIGADEFFAARNILTLQPSANHAGAGQSIGMTAIIENPHADAAQRGVTFTSIAPVGMEILSDSLQASRGEPSLAVVDGRQRIVWTGQVPARNAVVLRYRLAVAAADHERRWVTVSAATTGASPEMARSVETQILVNPHYLYLPLIATHALEP